MRYMAAMRHLTVISLLLACLVEARAFTWTPCDVGKVPFTPDVVQLVPDPPAAGGAVTFKIGGDAVHDVQSGTISIDVSFEGTQIYEEVDDLCGKTSCPIKTGPIEIAYVQDLPPIAPPGMYDVQVVARSTEGEELMCVVVHFEMLVSIFSSCTSNKALLPATKLCSEVPAGQLVWQEGCSNSENVRAASSSPQAPRSVDSIIIRVALRQLQGTVALGSAWLSVVVDRL